jgi:Flp pilus assembly protein TadD
MFLDTSMGPVAPGLLQPGVRGRSALLIRDSGSSIVDIPMESPVPQRIATSLKGRVTGAGAFEGSTRLEFQGFTEPLLRRIFLDATDAEKEKLVRQLAGPEFASANVRQLSSGDAGDLAKPFWVQCELSEKDFFPQSKTSAEIKLEWPSSLDIILRAGKPDQPFPVEPASFTRGMDLIVDTSLMIANGMPVHLKTPFGTMDSEFSYLDGHLQLKRSFQLNAGKIAPSDWDDFRKFMRSSEEETARGFTLTRRASYPTSTRPLAPKTASPAAASLREGALALRQGDYGAAKRGFLEATMLDPQSPSAWNDLGRAYAGLREYEDAERAYKRQIEINAEDRFAYNNLGLVYLALDRLDDAVASFRKQIEVVPRDRFAYFNLSKAFVRRKQWENALKEASIAVEITPDLVDRWVLLGAVRLKTGHVQEARDAFEQALAQPHDAMTENNIAYEKANAGIDLEKDWALISGTLDPEARRICEPEAVSKDDKCSPQLRRIALMLDTAGWVLYRQGKVMEAEPYVRSAFAISPEPENEMHLSILLAKLVRVDEALKHFANSLARAHSSSLDPTEARRELAKAAGGEAELSTRLAQFQISPSASESPTQILVLVDDQGKVLQAQGADAQTPEQLVDQAKSLALDPIAWPGHSIRTIRTIEFRKDGGKWSPGSSYVGSVSP